MRVLLLTQYFWPEQFRVNDLALGLQERGHEVTVLTGLPNYPEGSIPAEYRHGQRRYERFEGIPVFRAPLFARRRGRGWQLALNYLSFMLSACLWGAWHLRRKPFDVVFVFAPSPMTVALPGICLRHWKKAPLLFWVQDLWPESLSAAGAVHSPWVLRAVERMMRWIYRRCDRVLVQSRAFIEPVVRIGAERSRVQFFPNWAEDFYRPMDPNTTPLTDVFLPRGFRVMFAGNLGEAQSLETLVDAAEALRDEDIHWLIVGDGRMGAWMREQIRCRGLGDRMHMLGRHPAARMPCFFAHADALLVTLRDAPVFARTVPSKVQSYMACAKPIVAALCGEGARVIEEARCGRVVPAGDARGLSEAVRDVYLMDAEERKAMGLRGLRYYRAHFARDAQIDRLEAWMNEVKGESLCAS